MHRRRSSHPKEPFHTEFRVLSSSLTPLQSVNLYHTIPLRCISPGSRFTASGLSASFWYRVSDVCRVWDHHQHDPKLGSRIWAAVGGLRVWEPECGPSYEWLWPVQRSSKHQESHVFADSSLSNSVWHGLGNRTSTSNDGTPGDFNVLQHTIVDCNIL